MSTVLKDESELQKVLDYGLSPEPIIITKGNYYSMVNLTKVDGEYVNVLNAANEDYLNFPSAIVLQDGDSFIFNILVDSLITTQVIASMNDSSTYLSKNGGNIFIKLASGGFLRSGVVIGDNEVVLRRAGTTYYASINGGVESSSVDAGDFKIEQTSKLGASFFNGLTIKEFTINSELFPLNEPSGALFTGSLGTTGTRNTSSLDPDYIDDIMIQPLFI